MSTNKKDTTRSNHQEPQQIKPRDRIEFADDNLKYGFAQVPRLVLRAKGLSTSAKLVYAMLLDYAWQNNNCYPGQERLAEDLDISRRTVIRALDELSSYKLIAIKRQGLQKPNIYYILKLSENPNLNKNRAGSDNLSHQEVTKTTHQEVSKSHTNNTQSKDTQVNNTQIYLSRGKALKTEKGRVGESKETYSHIEQRAIGSEKTNGNNRKGSGTPTHIADVMQARLVNFQVEASVSSPATPTQTGTKQTRKRGHWKEAPLFIQAIISEWFSPEMHDQEVHSSITRADRLYKYFSYMCYQSNAELEQEDIAGAFREKLMAARRKAQRRTPTTWTEGTPAFPNGKPNRVPLFFACLEELLKLKTPEQKQQYYVFLTDVLHLTDIKLPN
jgi:predicted transcriptional regulator